MAKKRVRPFECVVTAWSDGSPSDSGAGYGLRVRPADRDSAFSPKWDSVGLLLPNGESVDVPLTGSFWRKCSELRSPAIGAWLLREGLAPWTKGKPPAFVLEGVGDRRFRVRPMDE